MHLADEKSAPTFAPRILLVGGGKGGVGKTCFSVNMAVEASRRGWRVILIDADLGCSNVETVLGHRAEVRLDDFFHQEGAKDLEPILCETQYDNLRLVPGTTGLLDVANPRYQQKRPSSGHCASWMRISSLWIWKRARISIRWISFS